MPRALPGSRPPGPEPAYAHPSYRQAAAHYVANVWPAVVHQPAPAVRHHDEHTLQAEGRRQGQHGQIKRYQAYHATPGALPRITG